MICTFRGLLSTEVHGRLSSFDMAVMWGGITAVMKSIECYICIYIRRYYGGNCCGIISVFGVQPARKIDFLPTHMKSRWYFAYMTEKPVFVNDFYYVSGIFLHSVPRSL